MISLLWRAADRLRRRRHAGDHGKLGEDLAHRYLRGKGCTVAARNYRPLSGAGEIDLVVWHKKRLAFIEVKTRATGDYGAPDAAVDAEKRRRLILAAADYARRANVPLENARFDIVSIVLTPPVSIDWQQSAFGYRGK